MGKNWKTVTNFIFFGSKITADGDCSHDIKTFAPWTKSYDKSSSVQFSQSVMSDSLRPHELQHARPPCPSPTPRVYSNSCPLSLWCHPTISSSVVPFSSCPQSFPASGSFQMSRLFTSGGQSTGVSASASVLPMNTLPRIGVYSTVLSWSLLCARHCDEHWYWKLTKTSLLTWKGSQPCERDDRISVESIHLLVL